VKLNSIPAKTKKTTKKAKTVKGGVDDIEVLPIQQPIPQPPSLPSAASAPQSSVTRTLNSVIEKDIDEAKPVKSIPMVLKTTPLLSQRASAQKLINYSRRLIDLSDKSIDKSNNLLNIGKSQILPQLQSINLESSAPPVSPQVSPLQSIKQESSAPPVSQQVSPPVSPPAAEQPQQSNLEDLKTRRDTLYNAIENKELNSTIEDLWKKGLKNIEREIASLENPIRTATTRPTESVGVSKTAQNTSNPIDPTRDITILVGNSLEKKKQEEQQQQQQEEQLVQKQGVVLTRKVNSQKSSVNYQQVKDLKDPTLGSQPQQQLYAPTTNQHETTYRETGSAIPGTESQSQPYQPPLSPPPQTLNIQQQQQPPYQPHQTLQPPSVQGTGPAEPAEQAAKAAEQVTEGTVAEQVTEATAQKESEAAAADRKAELEKKEEAKRIADSEAQRISSSSAPSVLVVQSSPEQQSSQSSSAPNSSSQQKSRDVLVAEKELRNEDKEEREKRKEEEKLNNSKDTSKKVIRATISNFMTNNNINEPGNQIDFLNEYKKYISKEEAEPKKTKK
jgi:hypothetical protein